MEEIKSSDAYKKALVEIIESDDYKNKVDSIEKEYQTNLEVAELYRKLKDIDEKYVKTESDWSGDTSVINWLANASNELIEELKKDELISLERSNSNEALRILNINQYDWSVVNPIILDLETRLQLIQVTDLDSIIKSIITYINIDKYIYIK
jgi:hypothetical protein